MTHFFTVGFRIPFSIIFLTLSRIVSSEFENQQGDKKILSFFFSFLLMHQLPFVLMLASSYLLTAK